MQQLSTELAFIALILIAPHLEARKAKRLAIVCAAAGAVLAGLNLFRVLA